MPSSPSQLRSLIMISTFVLHPKNRHRIFGISNAFSNVRCACSCSHSSLELRATHTLSLSAHHSNGRSTLLAYDAFSPLFLPTCFNESNTFCSFQCTTATIRLFSTKKNTTYNNDNQKISCRLHLFVLVIRHKHSCSLFGSCFSRQRIHIDIGRARFTHSSLFFLFFRNGLAMHQPN